MTSWTARMARGRAERGRAPDADLEECAYGPYRTADDSEPAYPGYCTGCAFRLRHRWISSKGRRGMYDPKPLS